jgi:hypothetical protein
MIGMKNRLETPREERRAGCDYCGFAGLFLSPLGKLATVLKKKRRKSDSLGERAESNPQNPQNPRGWPAC